MAPPSAPVTPGLRARSLGPDDEAFFPDEWGSVVLASDAAVQDGYFPASVLSSALQNLIAALPLRKQIASVTYPTGFQMQQPAGIPTLAQWAAPRIDDVRKVQADLEPLRSGVIVNANYNFLCWAPPTVGEILHDTHIRELAWEFLT